MPAEHTYYLQQVRTRWRGLGCRNGPAARTESPCSERTHGVQQTTPARAWDRSAAVPASGSRCCENRSSAWQSVVHINRLLELLARPRCVSTPSLLHNSQDVAGSRMAQARLMDVGEEHPTRSDGASRSVEHGGRRILVRLRRAGAAARPVARHALCGGACTGLVDNSFAMRCGWLDDSSTSGATTCKLHEVPLSAS